MDNINNFSATVASNLQDDDGKNYGFDPTLIVIIGSIILNAISLMIKCHVFGSMENRVKNPNLIDQMMLKKEIKKQLPQEYANLSGKVKDAILKSSQNLSSDEINKIIEEVKNERQN